MPDSKRVLQVLLWLWVGLLAATEEAHAQQYTVQGQVLDIVNDEPVPFANIYFNKGEAGTQTDFDGYYTLKLYNLPDSIIVSSLGYLSVAKQLSRNATQTVNFKLERSSYNLREVVVVAGENPAHILHRKVVKNKQNNSIESLESYRYESYNKLEIDFYDFEKLKDRKVMKPFQFVFEGIDSTSEETPFLPAFLSETLSDIYFRKTPKQQREVIKANRMSGINNESVTQLTSSMYQEVDIYDNWVDLLGKDFVSPISDQALNYYKMYLIDSAMIDGYWCYKLNFIPKNKGSFTFLGDMWIADSTYAVKKIDMQVADHVNINFVDRSSVSQEFEEVTPGTWMINKDKIVVKFKVTENAVGMIGRKTTTHRDILVNDPSIDTIFIDKSDIVVLENVTVDSDTFWEAHRHEELSNSERGIYEMVDSIKKTRAFKTWWEVVELVYSGYKDVGPVEFGPYGSLISINRVELVRTSIGIRTNDKFSERFRLGAYVAYGIRDKRIKYGFDGMVFLIKKPRLLLGGYYRHDLDLKASDETEFDQDNLLANLVRRQRVPLKLNFMDQWRVYLEKEWPIGVSIRMGFSNDRYAPQFPYSFVPGPDDEYKEGEVRTDFVNTSVDFRLRFAFREKFIEGTFNRVSLGTDYPTLIFKYQYGLQGVLDGGFTYHKFEVYFDHTVPINPIGEFNYLLKFGKVIGRLPTQLLEVHPGNETYFDNNIAFNLMNQYEFTSDMYVSLMFKHHFNGFFFDKIPGIRKLKWRSVIGAKAVIGTMTDENREANRLNTFKVPFKVPYVEASVGIENIFKLIRVEAVWRGTYRDDPKKFYTPNFGILVGLALNL